VVARTDLTEPEQFAEIIVKQAADARGSYPVRIADLGRVEIGAASERSSVRFKGGRRSPSGSSSRRRPTRSSCRARCAPSCRR
jgi:multidrug efflux pump subunit AcrB